MVRYPVKMVEPGAVALVVAKWKLVVPAMGFLNILLGTLLIAYGLANPIAAAVVALGIAFCHTMTMMNGYCLYHMAVTAALMAVMVVLTASQKKHMEMEALVMVAHTAAEEVDTAVPQATAVKMQLIMDPAVEAGATLMVLEAQVVLVTKELSTSVSLSINRY